MRANRLLSFAVAAALAATLTAQQPLPPDRATGGTTITAEQCSKWLHTLASPEFGGRGTGQEGFQKAADFVAAHFQSLGLEPRGDNKTFFQQVPWGAVKIDSTRTFVAFALGDQKVVEIPAERLGGNASANLEAKGEPVLLCFKPPARRDDGIAGLQDVDLAGKVAIVFLLTDGTETQGQGTMARFAVQRALADKKAAALLFASKDPVTGGIQGRAGAGRRASPAAAGAAMSPANLSFGGDDLTALLAAAKLDADTLKGAAVATPMPGLQATIQVTTSKSQAPACNVVGVLPGSDPKLRDEYVVIGSHLDHLGRRGETFFPGADDDGSGSTGVMAVAQAFAKNKSRPKRSVLFVAFCGEENGLIGSDFFVRNCPIPLSSIVGELQMDMIGRDEEESVEGNRGEKAEENRNTVHLIGTKKLSPALHELCLQKNAAAAFDIEYDEEGMFGRSDHANFAREGVPIAFFFTGLHGDYHKQSDTPDKINYEKLVRIAQWVYDIGYELAEQPGRPEIDPELWKKAGGRNGKDPAAPLIGGGARDDK
ncbi:MAG: M28 family peptidase [Planctomycetes bacterium]|nr:M28 family peptidase [Planctomycetota bacterium]